MSGIIQTVPGVSFAFLAEMLGARKAHRLFGKFLIGPADARYVSFENLWLVSNSNIHATGDERHTLGRAVIPVGTFELLAATLSQAETLREGLERVAKASALISGALRIELRKSRYALVLAIKSNGVPEPARSLYLSLWAIVFHCLICWLMRRELSVHEVRVPHDSSPRALEALQLLACPVRMAGPDFSISYSVRDGSALLMPLDLRPWEAEVFLVYRKLVARISSATRPGDEGSMAGLVQIELLSGAQRQSEICRALGLSPATLRRRLSDEGTSFRQIVDQFRQDYFDRLSSGGGKLEQIAASVGYSDGRSLRRARKRWKFSDEASANR
jgi:AraC-like DNA-binding protein